MVDIYKDLKKKNQIILKHFLKYLFWKKNSTEVNNVIFMVICIGNICIITKVLGV